MLDRKAINEKRAELIAHVAACRGCSADMVANAWNPLACASSKWDCPERRRLVESWISMTGLGKKLAMVAELPQGGYATYVRG